MATVTKGRTFVSGETVTPAKLNELVDSATVTAIQTADIADGQITNAKVSDSAAIALSKLATGALPTAITVASANLVDGTIVNADINASAAIAGGKLADASITAAKLDGAQTGSAPIYGCRAWVNFDGTAGITVDGEFRCTIRASGNVSKVVRTATGTYTIVFAVQMPDANYAMVEYHGSSALVGTMYNPVRSVTSVSFTTSSWNNAAATGGTSSNFAEIYALIFR